MAALSSHRRRAQARSQRVRHALVLEHLPVADAIASAAAWRLFPLVERDDLIQVAREALVRSAPRCRAGEPTAPYLRRCITGALQHHLRDRVRLVRIPPRLHEQGSSPLGHFSLDAHAESESCLLDQLAAPEAEPASARPQLSGSQSSRPSHSDRQPLSWRSAPCPCSGLREKALAALRQQLVDGR